MKRLTQRGAPILDRPGQVLEKTVNHKGAAARPGPGRGQKTGDTVSPVLDGALPKEITKMLSSRAQEVASWQGGLHRPRKGDAEAISALIVLPLWAGSQAGVRAGK